MTRLNKKEATFIFMTGVRLRLSEEDLKYPLSETDKIANRELWNNWTDSLCKDGRITQHQFDTWTYPRNKYFY